MPPPKHADLPVAPNKAAVPPTTPSLPSYEQQQVQLQQQQLFLMRQQAQRTGIAGQTTNALLFCVLLFVAIPVGLWLIHLFAKAIGL